MSPTSLGSEEERGTDILGDVVYDAQVVVVPGEEADDEEVARRLQRRRRRAQDQNGVRRVRDIEVLLPGPYRPGGAPGVGIRGGRRDETRGRERDKGSTSSCKHHYIFLV